MKLKFKQLLFIFPIFLFSCQAVKVAERLEQKVIDDSNQPGSKIKLNATTSINYGHSANGLTTTNMVKFVDAIKLSTNDSCNILNVKCLSKLLDSNKISMIYLKSYSKNKTKTMLISTASILGILGSYVLINKGVSGLQDVPKTTHNAALYSGIALGSLSITAFVFKLPGARAKNRANLFKAVDA